MQMAGRLKEEERRPVASISQVLSTPGLSQVPQQGVPATSSLCTHARLLGSPRVLFPIDRLQMKPASAGGKHFISIPLL